LPLRGKAEDFAQQHGWHKEFLEEQAHVPDYSENSQEWNEIVSATDPPVYFQESHPAENPAVGCHYYPPGLQLPPQPLRGLLLILLLGEQRHNGCEQFA